MKPSSAWLELKVERGEAGLCASAEGSRGEQTAPLLLGPDFSDESMERFSREVKKAADQGKPLGGALLEQARALQRALFREDIQTVWAQLHEAVAGGQVLLRLRLHEGALQSFPWEALYATGTAQGFLGSSPRVLPARGVKLTEAWRPREVSGAIRILPIAPSGDAALTVLKSALAEGISAGAVELLEPLTGSRARWPSLSDRLMCKPFPHVIHFIGHGGLEEGTPKLCLGDVKKKNDWINVERLGEQLQERLRQYLRLIVLEACEGARPGVLASAAELLARAGADAVVAHLWPVRADVARTSSAAFYRTLTGKAAKRGDVALALNHARRTVLANWSDSAEAFSPVLYLRGRDSVLFEFEGRRLSPPGTYSSLPGVGRLPPALQQLLDKPFTFLLGDEWMDERLVLDDFHEQLREGLADEEDVVSARLPLSALSQRYALRFGEGRLKDELEKVFKRPQSASPLLDKLASRLSPGVHFTLLRAPVLERALARQRPELRLYVIQPPGPGEDRATMMRREAGAGDWEQLEVLPKLFRQKKDLVVLRLYSGYSPADLFRRPLITEDDYLLGIHKLIELCPTEFYNFIMSRLYSQPVFLLGLSMLSWHHRILLYRLFEMRSLPPDSGVLLEPGVEKKERHLWESGQCLPGRGGVRVFGFEAPERRALFGSSPELGAS